ncbi:MAG: histidine kinase [Salinivirgaceae bacterium]|jgi:hypothetical protein|nr:histidine kinase [Salinivirgaceae bacterium]
MKNLIYLLALIISVSVYGQERDTISQLFGSRNYQGVVTVGLEKLKNNPEDKNLNSLIGRAYTALDEFETALPYLEKGTSSKTNWVKAWSHAYLGESYFMTGDFSNAKSHLFETVFIGATTNSVNQAKDFLNSFQMNQLSFKWTVKEAKQIRFHFQDISELENPKEYMKEREMKYKLLTRKLDTLPFKIIDYFVWNDLKTGFDATGKFPHNAKPNLCIINDYVDNNPGHALSHLFLEINYHPTIKKALIDEGIANYFAENERLPLEKVKQKLLLDSISLFDIWQNPFNYHDETVSILGASFIQYLIKSGGNSQLINLYKNQTIENAGIIYPQLDEIIKNYEKEYSQIKVKEKDYSLLYIGAIIIFVSLILWLFFFIKNNQLKKRELRKRELMQMELRAIRAQLNPHFLFNTLNSIQHLISENKSDEANEYISMFAGLMRKVLVNSEKVLIPLEEEIKLITTYLELEKLRFKFQYSIDVGKNLDIYNIEIPGLLFQPFVENAVIHGISGMKSNGIIDFRVFQQDEFLICEIEDNGKGFEKDNSGKNGKGISLTERRIQIIKEQYNSELSLDIIDKHSDSLSGTIVKIKYSLEK